MVSVFSASKGEPRSRRGSVPESDGPKVHVQLRQPTPGGRSALTVVGFEGPKGEKVSVTTAEVEERHRRFRMRRSRSVVGENASFSVSGPPADQLSITPPRPFHGKVLLSRGTSSGPRGTGAINVELPGGKWVDFMARRCIRQGRWPSYRKLGESSLK